MFPSPCGSADVAVLLATALALHIHLPLPTEMACIRGSNSTLPGDYDSFVTCLCLRTSEGLPYATEIRANLDLLFIPHQLLASVRLQAAAQHQLGVAIQAGLGSIDKSAAGGRPAVAGQLLCATEPADVELHQQVCLHVALSFSAAHLTE